MPWRGEGRQLCANQIKPRGKLPVSFHPRAGSNRAGTATTKPSSVGSGAGHGGSRSHGQRPRTAALSEDK